MFGSCSMLPSTQLWLSALHRLSSFDFSHVVELCVGFRTRVLATAPRCGKYCVFCHAGLALFCFLGVMILSYFPVAQQLQLRVFRFRNQISSSQKAQRTDASQIQYVERHTHTPCKRSLVAHALIVPALHTLGHYLVNLQTY